MGGAEGAATSGAEGAATSGAEDTATLGSAAAGRRAGEAGEGADDHDLRRLPFVKIAMASAASDISSAGFQQSYLAAELGGAQ